MGKLHKIILISMYSILLLFSVLVVLKAGSYYVTSQLERPYLDTHQNWRPSGLYGHGLGIIGSFFILLLLVYSIRKRVEILKNFGTLRIWLNYHIFFGIAGPLLIIFHTTFKFNGIVSLSFWSMIAVAISGFIGRYIYIQIPRARDGVELNINEIESLHNNLCDDLENKYGLTNSDLEKIEQLAHSIGEHPSILKILLLMPIQSLTIRFKINKILRKSLDHIKVDKFHLKRLRKLMLQKATLSKRIAILDDIHRFFHYWHIIHKPFAYIMILVMILHTSVAVYMGFTWIF